MFFPNEFTTRKIKKDVRNFFILNGFYKLILLKALNEYPGVQSKKGE